MDSHIVFHPSVNFRSSASVVLSGSSIIAVRLITRCEMSKRKIAGKLEGKKDVKKVKTRKKKVLAKT